MALRLIFKLKQEWYMESCEAVAIYRSSLHSPVRQLHMTRKYMFYLRKYTEYIVY